MGGGTSLVKPGLSQLACEPKEWKKYPDFYYIKGFFHKIFDNI